MCIFLVSLFLCLIVCVCLFVSLSDCVCLLVCLFFCLIVCVCLLVCFFVWLCVSVGSPSVGLFVSVCDCVCLLVVGSLSVGWFISMCECVWLLVCGFSFVSFFVSFFCLIVCLPISPSPIVLMASVDVKLHRTVAPSPSFYASLILSIDGLMTLPLARKWRLKFLNLWDLACQRSFGTCTKTT